MGPPSSWPFTHQPPGERSRFDARDGEGCHHPATEPLGWTTEAWGDT